MSASSPPARSASVVSSHQDNNNDEDDGDGAAYKMDSFGTMPLEKPSRDHSLLTPSVSDHDASTLTTTDSVKAAATTAAAEPSPSPLIPEQVQQAAAGVDNTRDPADDDDDDDDDEESVHSLPMISPETNKNMNDSSGNFSSLENSNVSLDINVEARTDEPLSRHDVYYASTDTFPTSNVFAKENIINNNNNKSPPAANKNTNNTNLRDVMSAHRTSIDTIPISNISGDSESRLTAVMSVGETTTSDLTTATGGTFDTSNAVVPGAYEEAGEDDEEHNGGQTTRIKKPKNRIVKEADDEGEEGSDVLMHTSPDENDDIPLEQLFANAQLKSQPDMSSGNPQDENYDIALEGDDSVPIMVEMDANPAVSERNDKGQPRTIIPLVDLENPPTPPKESTSRGTPSLATSGSGAASSAADNSTLSSGGEEATGGAISSLSSPTSTIETRKSRETSDKAAAAATAAVATTAMATADDKVPDHATPQSQEPMAQTRSPPYTLYICRTLVIGFVLLVVILSVTLFYTRDNENAETVATNAPTMLAPTTTTTTSPSQSPSTIATQLPTAPSASGQPEIPNTPSPSLFPSVFPVLPPAGFKPVAIFEGQEDGSRFGTLVSMSSNGDFVASLSFNPDEPVRTFQWRGNFGWLPFPSLPLAGDLALNASSSLEASLHLDAATTAQGFPVVAVSFAGGFQVYEHRGVRWIERGQFVEWEPPNASDQQPVASSTAVQLSSDASLLSAGFVSTNGESLLVQSFAFDSNTEQWYQRGNIVRRDRPDNQSPFLAISLALSGNGGVLAIGDWVIGNPQAVVERLEWNGLEWQQMGQELSLSWGPVAIALSHSGKQFAQVNVALGSAHEWDGAQWNDVGNGFIGGSSISMSGIGSRIIVGDAVQSIATILDYGDSSKWETASALSGTRLSRFGESVAMSRDGNVLSVGSPLEDINGTDVGQITLFQ